MKKGRPSTSYKRSEKKRNLTQNVLRKKKGGNVQINVNIFMFILCNIIYININV